MKAIIYDFDGVLVNSLSIKHNAFYEVLKEFGNGFAQTVLDYHIKTNSSRYETIKHAARLLNTTNSNFLAKKTKEFARLVKPSIIKATEIEGATNALKYCHNNNIIQFISSGSPQDELTDIVRSRGIDFYFEKIFGLPCTKEQHIREIMDTYNYRPEEVMHIGDTMLDYRASVATNVNFVARSDSGKFPVKVPVMKDLNQFLRLIKNDKNTRLHY